MDPLFLESPVAELDDVRAVFWAAFLALAPEVCERRLRLRWGDRLC